MSARILLAEDNPELSGLLHKFLADRGYSVTPALTGGEAAERLGAASFDLLVLDLRLPVISGPDLLARLRRTPEGAKLPVVVMSGVYRGERYVEATRRLGVRHYLEKPFRPAAFLAAVQEALGAGSSPSGMELLLDIHNRRRSGTLVVPQRSPVIFLSGEPATFGPAGGDNDFFSYLVEQGRLGGDEAAICRNAGEGKRYLTAAGHLTFEELAEESRRFLKLSIEAALVPGASAGFREEVPPLDPPLVSLSLPGLLYELKPGLAPFDADAFLAGKGALIPARNGRFFRWANFLSLRGGDIDLLEAVDARRTIAALVGNGPEKRERAYFFDLFQRLGMFDLRSEPGEEPAPDFPQKTLFNRHLQEEIHVEDFPSVDFDDIVDEVCDIVEEAVGKGGMAAPLSSQEIGFEQEVIRDHAFIQGKNYYEIFGMTPQSFSFDTLKQAYFSRSRQYSPEKFMELSGPTAAMAEEILSVYASGFNTLSSVVSKERYDELLNAETVGLGGNKDNRLQTQVQLQSGKVFLEMGEYENAEKALQDAYTLSPDDPEICAQLGWAVYRNPANKSSRASVERARSLLGRSLQCGKSAEAFAYRGWILLDEGRDALAEGEFQKALRMNAAEPTARKGMRIIAEKREAEKKGLFRKIFGS